LNKKITNKEKVKEALNKAGHRLFIDEVSHLTGLTKTQARGTANYYNSDIVSVGKGEIDLLSRAYKGRGLRVTPTEDDIRKGIILSDELFVYLWGIPRYIEEVTLLSENGMSFKGKREYLSNSQSAMSGFNRWYKSINFHPGDDIIFKCRDLNNQEFEIFYLPFSKRNKKEILHQNNRLGEIIVNVKYFSQGLGKDISHSPGKYISHPCGKQNSHFSGR